MNAPEHLRAGGIYLLTPPDLYLEDVDSRITPLLEQRAGAQPLVGILQLRVKQPGIALAPLGHKLRDRCRQAGVLFIVNDDPGLAGEVAADGVHLGRDDGSLEEARARLGNSALLGASCYGDVARAKAAQAAGADYLAFGAIHASGSKPEAPVVGLEALAQARRAVAGVVVAIGGISAANAAATRAAGADWLAVLGAVFDAADPALALRDLYRAWQAGGELP